MEIRAALPGDAPAIWSLLEPTIRAGETYALPRDMTQTEAIAYWMGPDRETFVVEEDGRLFATYYLRANQLGGGAHVANCGYVTSTEATGRRDRPHDVLAFARTGPSQGVPSHAIQLRREHERAGRAPLAGLRLRGRRHPARCLLSSEPGLCRCFGVVQDAVGSPSVSVTTPARRTTDARRTGEPPRPDGTEGGSRRGLTAWTLTMAA